MLRMYQSRDAQSARDYFTDALAREDYYTRGHETPGRWSGRGAALLGLEGREVTREAFGRLVENRHPVTGEQLTARQRGDRTPGYDISFHAPKGLSVLHALGHTELQRAFEEAVAETMAEMEREMKTRVRTDGANENRLSPTMLWGAFTHFTARPVEGEADPHLHVHCYTINATFDEAEGRWKAGQFRDLKRDAPYFEAAFHTRLAMKTAELGYAIDRTARGWDIAGVPERVKAEFSRRTAQIEKAAAELGVTRPESKSQLGARTRERKGEPHSREDLVRGWDARLTDEDREALFALVQNAGASRGPVPIREDACREAMDHAVEHCFSRVSVISEKRLCEAALRFGVGGVSIDGVKGQLEQADFIRREFDGQAMITTRQVLAEELAMLDLAREGRGQSSPLAPLADPARPVEPGQYAIRNTSLSTEQRSAVEHVLGSYDRVTMVRGAAGVGKTTLMTEVAEGVRFGDRSVHAFAPTAEAVQDVLRPEGFKAETVARLLVDPALQAGLRGQVIWIDEAGQLGARSMRQVLAIAREQDARVILTGDTRQHAAVERGDALRLLEKGAGIRPADVRSIRRQRGAYREAIERLVDGDTPGGFERLEAMGAVREIPDDSVRHRELAAAYVKGRDEGASVLVVSPTHAEGAAVTAAIREQLRARGVLSAPDEALTRIVSADLTEAQRRDSVNYREGQVVAFHQNIGKEDGGFKKAEKCTVVDVERAAADRPARVSVKRADGEVAVLPLHRAGRFEVFEPEPMPLAPGDTIRITRNGLAAGGRHRLVNGNTYTLDGFTKQGDLVLDNGWVVPRDYGHLSHGYCTTSHASQGKTVDRVLIAASETSFPASSREQFYVSASRARYSILIFTDDVEALREAVQRSDQRPLAVEMASGKRLPESSPIKAFARRRARLARYARLKADAGREERTRERPRAERTPITRDRERGR